MTDFYIPQQETEKAYLVGVTVRSERPLMNVSDSLRELELLAKTAGLEVVGTTAQSLDSINPSTFIGSGKVAEIAEALDITGAKVVILDDELSPRHQRELEKNFGEEVKVLDRSSLILDIFAQHAHTREGTLQVELAQYQYRLPRLTRQWTHLARQAGGGGSRSGNAGVGLRGPGETQLEVDRREIQRKIARLKQDIELVKKQRLQHRTQRMRAGVPVVALVGYTNAGKSTLLQALSGSEVYIADQLFATLDPTTRRVKLPSGREIVVTDTVGFIQKLPATLIAAFRATLEEIHDADLLLHVVDASHQNVRQHIETVLDTLAEIDVPPIPHILVWNKMDQLAGEHPALIDMGENFKAEVFVSARDATGLAELFAAIEEVLTLRLQGVKLCIPYERGDLVAMIYKSANVHSQRHTQDGVVLQAHLPTELMQRLEHYRIPE